MEMTFAQQFAHEWLEAWNSHDLTRILAHYHDDFEMNSPKIVQIAGEPSGRLIGKQAVGAYWSRALHLLPDLHFELITVLAGIDSVVIYYRGAKEQLVAEVFHFGPEGTVVRAYAHYA